MQPHDRNPIRTWEEYLAWELAYDLAADPKATDEWSALVQALEALRGRRPK